jgi:hypothetical protein
VGIDFVVKLPKLEGYNSILVVTNIFTKMTHLISCNKAKNIEGIADLLVHNMIKLHRILQKVISDWESSFLGKILYTTYNVLRVKAMHTIAYYPQADR